MKHQLHSMFTRLLPLVLVILYIPILVHGSVVAAPLNQEDLDAIYGGWVHYKVPGTTNSIGCTSDGVLRGDNNAKKAYNFLVDTAGLKSHQAAGVVGNLMGESSLIPNRKQGNGMLTITSVSQIVPEVGFGIAQWTSGGRQEAWKALGKKEAEKQIPKGATEAERKKTIDTVTLSLELQLQFLMQELNTVPGYGLKELRTAGDLRQATWIFLAFFERPAAVVDAELAENPTPPAQGPAADTLFARMKLAEKETGVPIGEDDTTGLPSSLCIGANLVNNTGLPSFKANRKVQVQEADVEGRCTDTFTEGAASLRQYILDTWQPPVTSVGGYSCRGIVGDESSLSLHGVGRAIDIMISAENPATQEVGDKIRNFLINNAEALQVQRVIWNRHIWSADQDGWRPYTGSNDHTDHLHVEINTKGAKNANLVGGI